MRAPETSAAVTRYKRAVIVLSILLAITCLGVASLLWKLYQQNKQQGMLVPTVYWVIGPFGPELQHAYEPEQKPDPVTSFKGLGGETLTWKELPVTEGVQCLDFRKLFKQDQCSGYALTYIHSPRDQDGTLLLGSDDTIRVWLNGALVHEYPRLRNARAGDDRVVVRWQQGWNTLLVKVVNAKGDHQFFLKCAGAPGLTANTHKTNY